ncbi:hypothetical protein LCGC14_2548090 [marine sediment metagenome]|uniref:GHMP kinase C-terminal domain-containing protein n=1 Tax=marine sediment metagenome TaxID=412755 RepID=A0A0F9ANR1_9ZZZZ
MNMPKGPLTNILVGINVAVLLLLWLGERPAASGSIIEEQTRGVKDGGAVLEAMHRTKARVLEMCEAIRFADVQRIGELLDLLWEQKKRFSTKISNPQIDLIYSALKDVGMIGGKITGAGGGGHMMACCQPKDRAKVIATAQGLGVALVPYHFVFDGVKVWQGQASWADATGWYAPAETAQPWLALEGVKAPPPTAGME